MIKTIKKENRSFRFDPNVPPVLTVSSGETVCFETQDCYDGQIDVDSKDFALLDMNRNNPITGPLFVSGAHPGDTLRIDILDIIPDDHGAMCIRTGKGIYEVEGCHCRRFPISGGRILFDHGIEIPIRPMVGVIGTCPAASCGTHAPGEHGGNLDIRDLGIGSSIYLPVNVPGALLSIGDCHAVQGDGETAICGLEICASVIVRVSVVKEALPTPFIETADSIYTAASDESLDIAAVNAARKMHRYLVESTELSDSQAAMLLSLAGDLRISQVVNPLKGAVMQFPKKYRQAMPK